MRGKNNLPAGRQVLWFDEVDKDDVGLVGGKGANLGEMVSAGFPVPYGFIVTAQAYFDFLKEHNLEPVIKTILNDINYENSKELHQAAQKIRNLIKTAKISHNLALMIAKNYTDLTPHEESFLKRKNTVIKQIKHSLKSIYKQPYVAVRSSATAEDLPDASFAGQQETFLNIKGEHSLIKKVQDCWASLFTDRAIYYRFQKKFDHLKVGIAVVVQRMVNSEKSGVAFSVDPVSNDKEKIVIEAILGLGEYIVGGKVTPDHYKVAKKNFEILTKEVQKQNKKLIRSGVVNKELNLTQKEADSQKLTDQQIVQLAILTSDIEKHFFFPQDIEWAIEKDEIYITQTRPITTLQNKSGKFQGPNSNFQTNSKFQAPILSGSGASPGVGTGPVKIIHSPAQIERIKPGDILVAPQTNPDYVPAMRKAAAIVTEHGGRTSHAAIVSRELGIPAVVGAEGAMKKLKEGMIITVNGATGEIYRGLTPKFFSDVSETPSRSTKNLMSSPHSSRTRTKLYVNLSDPAQAKKVADMNVDGVGLLRAEFMIANIGTHPKLFIKQKKQKQFVDLLTHELLKFAKAFGERPVIYRATDFKTNEYAHLKGGAEFENKEENPMLGLRGAARYINDPDVFDLELEAIRRVRTEGYDNLHLMIPFLRLPWELIKIKALIKNHGLLTDKKFKLWIMVEVPSCALNLDEFIKLGIDGISIGSNDLTMMLLGVDRDNEDISFIYDERNPTVLSVFKKIVEQCKKANITSSICGQAVSDYPEIVKAMIQSGITSISVNSDAVDQARELIYKYEQN